MSYKAEVLADAPNGYWRLGEKSGTAAADASGKGNNGTYKNEPELGIKGALASDPDTSIACNTVSTSQHHYVGIPEASSLDLGDTFTLEAWIRRDGTGGTDCIMDKGAGSFILRFDGENHLLLRCSSVGNIANSTTTINDGKWHHVVATKSGSVVHIYIDGVDVTGTVTNQTCVNTSTVFGIGASEAGGEDYFRGGIDEVAVYPTVLSAARVLAHYEVGHTTILPANTKAPTLTGTPKVGHELVSDTGIWEGEPTSYEYTWQRSTGAGWVSISRAAASTYKVTASDADHQLRCLVTAINPGGRTNAMSASLSVTVTRVKSGGVLVAGRPHLKTLGLIVPKPTLLFDGLSLSDYFLQEATGAIAQVADPLSSGQAVMKFTVNDADVFPVTPTADPRAQAAAPIVRGPLESGQLAGEYFYSLLDGSEVWIHTSFLLPASFPEVPAWLQIVQLFGPPFEGVAPWALKVQEGQLMWQRNATYGFDEPWIAPALERERWIDCILRLHLAKEGWVEMWINGQPITFFAPGTSYNPHREPESRRLSMQTLDASNNGIFGNAIFLQNYRKVGSIAGDVTLYHRPLIVKAA